MNLYTKSRLDYRRFLSLTSLALEEFLALLSLFSTIWENYHQKYDLKGKLRKIPTYKVDKRESLACVEEKLFFILVYMKENPNQDYQGAMFGLSQGKVSQWIGILLPCLEKALARQKLLPARTGRYLLIFLKTYAEHILWLDATERPIPRSSDGERQKFEYSGKKHLHTLKNTLISDINAKIVYLGTTYEGGSCHDKKMLDEADLTFLPETNLLLDLGRV